MNPKYKTCAMTKVGTMLLPAGRLSYPALFKARAMPGEPEEKAKFSTTILLPAGVDLKPAVDWALQVAIDKWGQASTAKLRKPFLKTAEKVEDTELATAFPVMIRASTTQKPNVVFANGNPCNVEDEVYPGRWARVSVRAFPWEHKANGRGVSFGLSNVLLLDHDDRIGGGRAKVEDEFEFDTSETGGEGDPDSIFK